MQEIVEEAEEEILSWLRGVEGITIRLPTTTKKLGPQGVMSNAIKDLGVSSSSSIGFKVEWHNSRSDKWYRSQGHGFESWECHCNEGIVRGTTIQLPTIILKTGPRGVMSNAIKDLSVSFSSPIGFEVEWHSSRSDKGNVENRGMEIVRNC